MYSDEEEYSSASEDSDNSSSSSSDASSSSEEEEVELSSEAELSEEQEEAAEEEAEEASAETEKRSAGRRRIKRQLEYYNILPTWGTESAEEYNISPQQLLDLVLDIEDKVSLYRLSTALADAEIASCFIAMEGVPALMTCLTSLTGNSLAYAVNALLSFVRHDFAIDELTAEIRHLTEGGSGEARVHKHPITKSPVYCREQLLELISSTQEGAENARALHLGLEVMTHICSRSMDAFTFLHSSALPEQPSEDQLRSFYRSITAPLEHLGLDVQLACLRLVNSVVSCAHDPEEYDEIVRHLTTVPGFTEKLGSLKDESSNVALLREITRFETQTAEGFGHKNVLLMMKSDVQQLQKQLQDVSSVATEYMTQNNKLQAELSAFRRREPLVQLLWKEISHCRKALHRAIEAGFSFDLGAPDRRWAPPAGMADIGQLWVLEKQFGGGLGKGGGGVESFEDLSSDSEEDSEEEQNFMRLGNAPTTAEMMEREIIRSTSTEELVNLAAERVEPTLTLGGGGGNLALGPPTDTNTGILAPPSAGGIMAPPSKVHLGAGGMLAPPPNLLRAPQPSKPVIKPPVKMKPLHWKRIILEDKTVESVWNEIGDNFDEKYLKLDTAVTVKYFEDKKRKKRPEIEGAEEGRPKAGRGGGGAGKGASRIVDDKTFQTLAILLRSLPAIPETVRAIKHMDSTMLSASQVTRILKSLPDQETMRKVETAPEMDSELSLPDLYVRELSRIPQISARLDCWSFVLNFEERLNDIRGPVKALLEAFDAVRSSPALRKALGTVLTVGNFLNGNTTRGQADGFQLEVLRRLKMFKDSEDGDLTLLQYISDLLLERFGQDFAEQLWKELELACYAQEHNMDQVIADVSSFTQAVNTKKKLASLVISASPDADRFASTMNRFYGKAEKKLSKLRTDALDARRAFEDVKIWVDPFGREHDLKQIKTTDFFPNLVEFAESVKACAQRRQREKEEAEERRRMLERQEAARQERERRLAAAGEKSEKERKGLKIKLRPAVGHGPQPQLNIAELRGQLRKRGGGCAGREDVKEAEWEDGDEDTPTKEKREESKTASADGPEEDVVEDEEDQGRKKSSKKSSKKQKKERRKKKEKKKKKTGEERRAKSDNDRSSGDSSSETDSDANLEPDSSPRPALLRAKTSVEGLSSKKKEKKKQKQKKKDKKSKKDKKEKKDKDKKKKRSRKEGKSKVGKEREKQKREGSPEEAEKEE